MNWKSLFNRRNEEELLKKHFHYLFDDYGFSLAYVRYSDIGWFCLSLSNRCRISLEQMQGYITLYIGPLWEPADPHVGPWFDLQIVIAYLNHGELIWDYKKGSTESELEQISSVLRINVDQICSLFDIDAFSGNDPDFPMLQRELEGLYSKQYEKRLRH